MADRDHPDRWDIPDLPPFLHDAHRQAVTTLTKESDQPTADELALALMVVLRMYTCDMARHEREQTYLHERWAADYHKIKARLVKLEALVEAPQLAAVLEAV